LFFSEESTLLGQFTNKAVCKLAQQRCWKKEPFFECSGEVFASEKVSGGNH
jgi:hypothetical protein